MEALNPLPLEATKNALYQAVVNGDLEAFRVARAAAPALLIRECRFSSSKNLLHLAVLGVHGGIVQELLSVCCPLTRCVDDDRNTPLHYAVEMRNLEIVEAVLGADPRPRWLPNYMGLNPVHMALLMDNFSQTDTILQRLLGRIFLL